MSGHNIIVTALSALLGVNAALSFAVARSAYYERRQKIRQIVFVWALPLIGGTVVGVFLYSDRGTSRAVYPVDNDLTNDLTNQVTWIDPSSQHYHGYDS